MLNVKKSSVSYSFLENNLLREMREFPASQPNNLCPYMRKLLLMPIWVFMVYFVVLFLLQPIIHVPIMLLMGVPFGAEDPLVTGTYFEYFVVAGSIEWAVIIVASIAIGIGYALHRYEWFRNGMDKTGHAIATPFVATSTWVKNKAHNNVVCAWYKAIHDKICPQLNFVNDD